MSDAGARVAIVTGASSGIGEASARALARAGFRVALVARRAERLEALAKEIATQGGEALALPTDLAREDATAAVVTRTLAAYGRVDVLLNNAGYSPAAALEQLSRDEIRRAFEVNLFAGLQLAGAVTPTMRAQGGGRILNMSSLAATAPAPIAVPYNASKAAINQATRCLRLEVAPWNIHVSLIVPGFVDTDTFDNSRATSAQLRADPNNPYQKLMLALDDYARASQKTALPPEAVARVIVRAATARRPRETYYVPFSARLQSGFLVALPERARDALLRRVFGSAG